MLNFSEKIIPFERLLHWRCRTDLGTLVVTNGCFDILHAAHVSYLQASRNLGDNLLVGINGDTSVSALKGSGRPVNREEDRAAVIAALEAVNFVCVFPGVSASLFLVLSRPSIWTKGGDYTLESVNQVERRTVEMNGGKVQILPFTQGKSTSLTLAAAKKAADFPKTAKSF